MVSQIAKAKQKRMVAGIAAGVAVLLIAGFAFAGEKGCPPFKINEAEIDQFISEALDDGMRSAESVAEYVAKRLYEKHPTSGATLQWPPGAKATPEQLCLWTKQI